MSTLFAIFLAVWSGSTLFAILRLIRVYTICLLRQSDWGLHFFPFSAVSSGSTLFPFSVWSGSTLFATLCNLIRICTICHSSLAVLLRPKLFAFVSRLIRFYTISWKSHQCLHYLPFSVWSGSTLCSILSILIWVYTFCHYKQSDQGLHCLPFSAVCSGSTLLAILSSLIRI